MKSTSRRRLVLRGLAGLAALLLAAGLGAQERRPGGVVESPHAIHLKSGTFEPAPGIEPELRETVRRADRPVLGLLQLDEVPDEAVRAQLERAGVELFEYIPNNTWIARLPVDVERVASVITVRWVGRLLPQDKLSPDLGQILTGQERSDLILNVEAVKGSVHEAAARVQALGGRVLERDDELSALHVALPHQSVQSLAASDAVLWISPQPPRALFNNRSRANANANQVQATPYGLTGAGVQLGIWDGGQVFTHTDFTGRLTRIELGGSALGQRHATHVTGTMAGSGARSQPLGFAPLLMRGYATGAQIISYIFDGVPYSEHNAAINTWGIDLSQNSWGYVVDSVNCAFYGDYYLDSREYDRIVTGAYNRRIPVVFAAGNERDDGDCGMSTVPPFLNYSNLPPPGTAKDIVTVGAINGDNSAMTAFSSWGPTDDGRLKPEVVAAGCNVNANPQPAIFSTVPTNGYDVDCGTSMAAPAVSGSIGLLLQRYRTACPATGTDPLPSTLKALLIHSARDLDDATSYFNRGPDYASGYGALDVQAAVDLLPFHREDQVGHGQTDTFQITVTQQSNLKVTLAWDDPAAAANAAVALVNNLNLELVAPNGTVHRPWVLSPAAPASNATRGVDNRNVVEQVVVDSVTNLTAGVWTIRVIGTNVPNGPQRYSLVTQHLRHADLSCHGAPAGDAWIMDKDAPLAPVDTGAEPNPDNGPMWISNQIWVRHSPDNIMVHQNPDFGNDNSIYARIRNRGATSLNTVRVMIYYANASAGLSWPRDWTLIGERTVVNLAAGASRLIAPLTWRPPGTGHYCLYARLVSDQDSMTFPEGNGVHVNTRNNNEIAWRNVNVVDVLPNRARAGAASSTGPVQLLIANTVEGDAELAINFDMIPDEFGNTLFDFASVTVHPSEELLDYLSEQGVVLDSAGGFEKIDDVTFQMIAPTAFLTSIPVSGPRSFPLTIEINTKGMTAPSGVYTLDVNQNFPPHAGSTEGSVQPRAVGVYDPEDPNAGGVRYDVFVPSGKGNVAGTVTDADGNPLPGVTVTLGRDSSLTTVTNGEGWFKASRLDAGPWSVSVALEGFEPEGVLVNVPSGGTAIMDLVLAVSKE